MYDGSEYFGFAKQSARGGEATPTVALRLEEAISKFLDRKTQILGASRTDRGVHAIGQTINFLCFSEIRTENLKSAINFYLPGDIRILKAEEVSLDFHSRFSAKEKEYCYTIFEGPEVPYNFRGFAHHVHRPIGLDGLKAAAGFLIGEHDFASFGSENKGNTVRKMFEIKIEEELHRMGRIIRIYFRANAFLYKMIRSIVGTILEVGMEKREKGEIPEILEAKDRKRAGVCAPPQGLCLMKVGY